MEIFWRFSEEFLRYRWRVGWTSLKGVRYDRPTRGLGTGMRYRRLTGRRGAAARALRTVCGNGMGSPSGRGGERE